MSNPPPHRLGLGDKKLYFVQSNKLLVAELLSHQDILPGFQSKTPEGEKESPGIYPIGVDHASQCRISAIECLIETFIQIKVQDRIVIAAGCGNLSRFNEVVFDVLHIAFKVV